MRHRRSHDYHLKEPAPDRIDDFGVLGSGRLRKPSDHDADGRKHDP
ncbi:hypothetical protein V5279_05590 [Bradyrhizobium sp. 26S5]